MEPTDSQLDAPDLNSEKLAQDLAEATRPTISVPQDVDERMQALARSAATRVVLRRTAFHRWAWTAAAAAAILLAVTLWYPRRDAEDRGVAPLQPVARAEDLDGSGTVDILDAFFLARRIEQRTPADPRWDINGDGSINKADVDRIAMIAVSIKRGRS